MKGFIAGIVFTLAAAALAGYVFIVTGAMPANADAPPGSFERWAAHASLHATIDRQAPKGAPPIAPTQANLSAGLKVYAADCAVCHGASDGRPSRIALGLYQHAPQLAKHGVEDDAEGETYWKVYHGIRLTGMPAFSRTLSQDELWQVSLFLKHMNALPAPVGEAWKKLPSEGGWQAPAAGR